VVILPLPGCKGQPQHVRCLPPEGRLVGTCDTNGWVFFWRASGQEKGRLLGLFHVQANISTMLWKNATHILLATESKAPRPPAIYHLSLEGSGWQ
jgi:hypothetical protein